MRRIVSRAEWYNYVYGENKIIKWFYWYFLLRWTKDQRRRRKVFKKLGEKE